MPTAADILWLKRNFQPQIEAAVAGTAFDVDMIVAIACQETGNVWSVLRQTPLTLDRILALCVGDTIDADKGRGAFPRTKADLIAQPNGQPMFDIARQALVDIAAHIPAYRGAASNLDKFCHGFGMFQYDLQFFLTDPDYFLQKRYETFGETLRKALDLLRAAARRTGHENKPALADPEMAAVAIAYNTGRYDPGKGLKQGYFNGQRFYGEQIRDFLRLSRAVR